MTTYQGIPILWDDLTIPDSAIITEHGWFLLRGRIDKTISPVRATETLKKTLLHEAYNFDPEDWRI